MPNPKQLERVNLSLFYPPFRAKLYELLDRCEKRGAIFFLTRGCDTFEVQDQLYAQGRTAPGVKVTNARGGESGHNFGIADDLTHDRDGNAANGLQPDWTQANYVVLAEECEAVGLTSGRSFSDWPHVNLPGYERGSQLEPLRKIYLSTKGDHLTRLKAVWGYLDTVRGSAAA